MVKRVACDERTRPQISVVMATFNGEKYIKEQIESILCQTVKPDEIVICDDCSNDKTLQIVKDILDKSSIAHRYIQHETNKGVLSSFYDALKKVTGDIIFFSDQDDVWKSDKIEKIYPQFTEKNVNLVLCNADIVDWNLRFLGKTLWQVIKFTPTKLKDGIVYITGIEELLKRNYATGMCMAIRKSLLENLDMLSPYMLHDEYFAWKALCYGHIVAINSSYVLYRQHNNNVIGVKGIKKEKNKDMIIEQIIKSSEKTYKKLVELNTWDMSEKNRELLLKAIKFYNWRSSLHSVSEKRKIVNWIKYNLDGNYRNFSSKTEHARLKDLFLILA